MIYPRLNVCTVGLLLSGVLGGGWGANANAAAKIDFSRQILPVLSENCFYCHGPDPGHRKADLRLDQEKTALEVIVRGKSGESTLIERILAEDPDERMPPVTSHKKLTPQQIAVFKQWIDEGAHWGEHWSLTPVSRPTVPTVKKAFAGRNSIDAFVGERLEREGLAFSPEAEKTTLIRRVTLDLTGLPPSRAEVDAFVKNRSRTAYEDLVDRLLASPAYGERMAWDWMEVARYADSNGYQGDQDRTMWPWRDWVVKAFNQNLRYDDFTRWQLAGDLLPQPTTEQKLATAFARNHPINGEGGRIAEESRVDYVMDMAETTATAWLGLTFTCARCHDHKFDPITRKDYYSLFAFFNQTPVTGEGRSGQTKPLLDLSSPEQTAQWTEFDRQVRVAAAQLDESEKDLFSRAPDGKTIVLPPDVKLLRDAIEILGKPAYERDAARLKILEKEFDEIRPDYARQLAHLQEARKVRDDFAAPLPKVMIMEDQEKPRATFILDKGLYNKPVEEIGAATMARLPPMPAGAPRNRLGLANWLVAPDNPLTPRVTVNRLWQMFFGMGLVKTSEDFGTKGELPIHPELLDWLACEFRDSGWDVKQLLRLIVTSRTYRQSSRVTPELLERDRDNRLLARGARFRMPSWMLRDQALAASGLLSARLGGPSVRSYQPPGVWEEATFGNRKYEQEHGEALYRRSLYIFWRRIIGPTQFFDTPSRLVCNVKPMRTNTPLHALATLNDVAFVEAARVLAERTMLAASTSRGRIDHAFRAVVARPPTAAERKTLLAGFGRMQALFGREKAGAAELVAVGEAPHNPALDPVDHAAWTATCLVILNLDEALTKE